MIAGKEKIARYFEDLLAIHGDHFLSLDWKSKDSQAIRFNTLLDVTAYCDKKDGFSLLDVGCGIGHMNDYLRNSGLGKSLKIDYYGIDISQKLVDFASKKHPGIDYRVVDLVNDKFGEKYDYVVSSGAFNIRMDELERHKESVRKMLSRICGICRNGAAVNFLSLSSIYLVPEGNDVGSDRYVYFTEEEVISWVRPISERFVLRRDYHPGDFTVYMLK